MTNAALNAAIITAPFTGTEIFVTVMVLLGAGLVLVVIGAIVTGRRGEARRDARTLDTTPLSENPETAPWRRK